MSIYKHFIRKVLFNFSPETAHKIVFSGLKFASYIPGVASIIRAIHCSKDPRTEREVFGIKFPNPIGLAAGLDKDAEVFDMLGNLGFGFIEIGTVTPLPQAGNPSPRLFRLVPDSALINRMGFNNKGIEYAYLKLLKRKTKIIIGGNIGKNKLTPNESAETDYTICFEKLFPVVDFFTVNISSPNTPNLRELQDKEPLQKILSKLQDINKAKKNPKPILLKIAPDLSYDQIDDILEIIKKTGISGIVATNTTIERTNLKTDEKIIQAIGPGGLSGKPVRNRSTEIVRYIAKKTQCKLPIVAVGGIMNADDALEKFHAGASLVQIYTGFIYEGPKLIREINRLLLSQSK